MKNEQREKAIKEWNNLTFEQKYFMIVKNKSIVKGYPDRSPDTLTGREIEEIIANNQKLPA
jgi:hypothetical protein